MLIKILYVILQACFASFFYCLYQRLPMKDSFMMKRSKCEYCKHELKWFDLIPIISYIILKGKCRYCNKIISIKYLLVEVVWSLINVIIVSCYEINFELIIISIILLDVILISILDMKYQLIYDCSLIILLICSIYYIQSDVISSILAGVLCSGFLVVCNLIIKDSFGMGDIKLCFIVGLMLKDETMNMMILAIILCGSICYYLLLFKKYDKKMHIAFAPYLCIAMFYYLVNKKSIGFCQCLIYLLN